ncbi:hypothetical protein SODALDRAFT_320566 [Sodiomyces alkalinus F11]|uniref:Uncharacterized protein n=1 Tax=Sodiomyces alkalinus (strain CBS 110278 / VKM F-3762 / F11) TaxID=1314773 RepID=A0A3N2PP50_SODAK|nr:hypothetical protein SODALDRAFT_320566 [Sodiomyces alkalinus F11]ROT36126.1 hypothetical protein SODALDRAFT_320566 [Sodiomyces alkalinus F11]
MPKGKGSKKSKKGKGLSGPPQGQQSTPDVWPGSDDVFWLGKPRLQPENVEATAARGINRFRPLPPGAARWSTYQDQREGCEPFLKSLGYGQQFPMPPLEDPDAEANLDLVCGEADFHARRLFIEWNSLRRKVGGLDCAVLRNAVDHLFKKPRRDRQSFFEDCWEATLRNFIDLPETASRGRLARIDRQDIAHLLNHLDHVDRSRIPRDESGPERDLHWPRLKAPHVFQDEGNQYEKLNFELFFHFLMPRICQENLNDPRLFINLLVSRGRHHPANFTRRDMQESWCGWATRWFSTFTFLPDVAVSLDVPDFEYSEGDHERMFLQTHLGPNLQHNYRKLLYEKEAKTAQFDWQRGRGFPFRVGFACLYMQHVIVRFLNVVSDAATMQWASDIRELPMSQPVWRIEGLPDYRDEFINIQGWGHVGMVPDLKNAESIQKSRLRDFSSPQWSDMRLWSKHFRARADEALLHLKRLMHHTDYFLEQVDMVLDHHHGRVVDVDGQTLPCFLEETSKLTRGNLIFDVVGRIFWRALLDLEAHATLAIECSTLKTDLVPFHSSTDGLIESIRPWHDVSEADNLDDQLDVLLWLNTHVRWLADYYWREICDRGIWVAGPHAREHFFRETPNPGEADLPQNPGEHGVRFRLQDAAFFDDVFPGSEMDSQEVATNQVSLDYEEQLERAHKVVGAHIFKLLGDKRALGFAGLASVVESMAPMVQPLLDAGYLSSWVVDPLNTMYWCARLEEEVDLFQDVTDDLTSRQADGDKDLSLYEDSKTLTSLRALEKMPILDKDVVGGHHLLSLLQRDGGPDETEQQARRRRMDQKAAIKKAWLGFVARLTGKKRSKLEAYNFKDNMFDVEEVGTLPPAFAKQWHEIFDPWSAVAVDRETSSSSSWAYSRDYDGDDDEDDKPPPKPQLYVPPPKPAPQTQTPPRQASPPSPPKITTSPSLKPVHGRQRGDLEQKQAQRLTKAERNRAFLEEFPPPAAPAPPPPAKPALPLEVWNTLDELFGGKRNVSVNDMAAAFGHLGLKGEMGVGYKFDFTERTLFPRPKDACLLPLTFHFPEHLKTNQSINRTQIVWAIGKRLYKTGITQKGLEETYSGCPGWSKPKWFGSPGGDGEGGEGGEGGDGGAAGEAGA